MLSTYLGYSIATRDMTSTLSRIASQSQTKRAQAYYDANIGKVKTVDDFVNNYQLFSYAMDAYGLSDMTYGKAFMKKVLTSDLSDSNSFANRLNDPRYKAIAAAYNFGTSSSSSGTAGVSSANAAQSSTQTDGTIDLYEQSFADESDNAKAETDYYSAKIANVTNVDQILGDDRLKDYVLKANGIDPTYISNSYLRSVLTSDVSDPSSFVNQNSGAAFKALAAEFSFNADGTSTGASAQTAAQATEIEGLYNATVPSYTTYAGATANDTYYKDTIGTITSVGELTSNTRLFSYVKNALGLNTDLTAYEFNTAAGDPSFAATFGLTSAIASFNFQPDGTVAAGEQAQSADQIAATSSAYMKSYDTSQSSLVTDAEKNYRTKIAAVTKIDDFFASNQTDSDTTNDDLPDAYQVALRAYGIDPGSVTKSQIKKVLESDPYDSKSYVNSLKDDRFVNLAKAFNFDSSGNLRAPVQALSQGQINSYISQYTSKAKIGLKGAQATQATDDAKDAGTYFATNIVKITDVTDLLADTKLTDFILKASGIDPKTVTTDTLKKAFASDPTDPKSFVNTNDGAKFANIVSAFNFGTDGNLTNSKLGTVQNEGARLATDSLYLRQTLEDQQGDTNPGVRLALYFQRNASNITSVYDIMGDQALYSVIQTTFNLPSSMSAMDVDQQASLIGKSVNVADFQDPSKVDKLLKRFSAMYDMQNSTSSSPGLSILQGSSSSYGISADMMLSLAQLKLGG